MQPNKAKSSVSFLKVFELQKLLARSVSLDDIQPFDLSNLWDAHQYEPSRGIGREKRLNRANYTPHYDI